jgi:hypothetical protein
MKPLKITTCLFLVLLLSYSCAVQQKQPSYTQDQAVDLQVFYDELSPYGNWVDYSNYGYIWIPDVRREFAPYATNGHWVMTDYGWTWVSDYRWGWATFHYGRWDYDDYYGWFWVPGNEWGPAWVTWRGGNGYYGWAPMRPGMNINSSYNDQYRDVNRWNFVRDRDFGRNDLDRHYVNRGNYTTIINNSTIINNTTVDHRRNATYIAGPEQDNVQRATGRNISRVKIQDNERPGQRLGNNELKIYRPEVARTASRRTAPPKVTDIGEIKPVRERGSGTSRNDITGNAGEERQTDRYPQKERRRTVQQPSPQQPIEKSTQIPQTQPMSPEVTPGQHNQNEGRRRRERSERLRTQQEQNQNRQTEQNRPGTVQQPTPVSPVTEQKEIQQEQQTRQDITKEEQIRKQQQLQVQQQQRQVERQQQQLERQQQLQRRRQERQETRQQQQIEKSQRTDPSTPAQQENEQEQRKRTPSEGRRR